MEKIASKPRLAENEDDCWQAIYEKIKEYQGHGLVVVEVICQFTSSSHTQNIRMLSACINAQEKIG